MNEDISLIEVCASNLERTGTLLYMLGSAKADETYSTRDQQHHMYEYDTWCSPLKAGRSRLSVAPGIYSSTTPTTMCSRF